MEKPLNQQILDRIYELTGKVVTLDTLSRQAVEEIAAEVRVAIRKNISSGGRWDGNESNVDIFSGGSKKWAPLASSTKRKYSNKGISPLKPTMRVTGNLERSIDVYPGRSKINVVATAPYAAIHQHGGVIKHPGGTAWGWDREEDRITFIKNSDTGDTKRYSLYGLTRPHEINMPARPYIVLQEETLEIIVDIAANDVITRLGGSTE